MKKNKMYILLAILTAIFLFSFAALCNQCGTTTEEEKTGVGEEEETATEEEETVEEEETATEEGETTEEETAEEEEEEEEVAEEDRQEPTIELEIYQGPIPADGICYYRVQATVSGNPAPSVEFSKDDSGSAWGTKKAQVNLYDPSETYTLVATATNSEGTDTDSIIISWGCEVPEPEPTEVEVEFFAEVSKCGYIFQDTGAYSGTDIVYIGDTATDKVIKGYLSFDIGSISALEDITITEVEVEIPGVVIYYGSPWLAGDILNIKVYPYGDTLDLSDYAVGGELVKTFDTSSTLDDFSFSSSKLKDELQKAVDISRENFQFKFGLNTHSNNHDADCYKFLPSSCKIKIKYEIIE